MGNPLGSEFIRLQGSRMQRRAVSTLIGGQDEVLGVMLQWGAGGPGTLKARMVEKPEEKE